VPSIDFQAIPRFGEHDRSVTAGPDDGGIRDGVVADAAGRGCADPLTLLASQVTIYIVRTRDHAWTSRPSTPLITATAANIAVALTLALTGTLKTTACKMLALHRLWCQNDHTCQLNSPN
jgi:hypothetical protein